MFGITITAEMPLKAFSLIAAYQVSELSNLTQLMAQDSGFLDSLFHVVSAGSQGNYKVHSSLTSRAAVGGSPAGAGGCRLQLLSMWAEAEAQASLAPYSTG